MFKISSIETESQLGFALNIARLISDMEFSITVGKANSRQITSDIDSRISRKLEAEYQLISKKHDLSVCANNTHIGEVDLAVKDVSNGDIAYIEIEKTNKKTLWFDYVKLLSKIGDQPSSVGIVICPRNYAHKIGVWDLYQDAIIYRNHLARLSRNENLSRIAVIGYIQMAYVDEQWQEIGPEVVQRLKEMCYE
jgi:hypothetical protein